MAIIYGHVDSVMQLLSKYPDRVKRVEDIPKVKEQMWQELKEEAKKKGFINRIKRWNKTREYNKFVKHKHDPFHAGAKGELKVVEELKKLDNNFHVLCDVKIGLPYWIKYDGRRNLKSAQMDFVVVGPKGVFMIEVKNWSDNYLQNFYKENTLISYEQTERAGKVLWFALKDMFDDIRVINVLLSVQANIEYNKNYKRILVSNPDEINHFIRNRGDYLHPDDVKKIVSELRNYVIQ